MKIEFLILDFDKNTFAYIMEDKKNIVENQICDNSINLASAYRGWDSHPANQNWHSMQWLSHGFMKKSQQLSWKGWLSNPSSKMILGLFCDDADNGCFASIWDCSDIRRIIRVKTRTENPVWCWTFGEYIILGTVHHSCFWAYELWFVSLELNPRNLLRVLHILCIQLHVTGRFGLPSLQFHYMTSPLVPRKNPRTGMIEFYLVLDLWSFVPMYTLTRQYSQIMVLSWSGWDK